MRDFLVKIALRLGVYQQIVEQLNRYKFKIQARRMKKDGLKMLSAANAVFEGLHLEVFLTFGTLLGAYRDHGFIAYDPDIDLGVLNSQVPSDLHDKMAQAGFRLERQTVLDDKTTVVEETYRYGQLNLDIFYYFETGEDWFCYCARKHEHKEWKEANQTDGFPCVRSYVPSSAMEKQDFLGVQVYCPVRTADWLRAIYSDSFMTPIPNWNPKDYPTRLVPAQERTYRILY